MIRAPAPISYVMLSNEFCAGAPPKIKNIQFKNNLYLMGYFQSESYFNDNKDIIVKEIFPPEPKDKKYLELKEKISHQSSIAVGVRMHENIDKEFGFNSNSIIAVAPSAKTEALTITPVA